jgi:chaperonin GroEL
MGIIDATKVTRNALKNSISVAGTIMSTAAVVSNIRE